MARSIRYRTGLDRQTGKPLSGAAHLVQSLDVIWTTRLGERVMLLDFGSNLRALLSEDITPALALALYNELVLSAYRWEPEYRVDSLQLVRLTETGALGVRPSGLYYPEGRFGNYDIAAPLTAAPRQFGLTSARAA